MEINKNYDDKKLIMEVTGRVDTITSQDLEKSINEEIGKFDSLTIDFEKVEYISSAGLRVLIATQKKLKKDNVPLVIENVNDTIKEIFRMSGFDKILEIQ
ncbi:MAG: STAS domain-containing protein [Methanosphaera sp.]|nr:STAS domain-containing protein [Methanosphaera sp.]